MICVDTNIIIYLAKGVIDDSIAEHGPICYPSIVKIEALGFQELRAVEDHRIRALFATFTELPLSQEVIEIAISLRQEARRTLGDAIVAASALNAGADLWTANDRDFVDIRGLAVVNPVAKRDKT